MSNIVLYGVDISPPVRACLLTLKALEVPFEYYVMDLQTQEHLSEDYKKHNPQHTVPTLNDNGTWIWDSHAICAYLVDKYGKSDSLYPKDLAKRAIVDQRMYFDASILFMALRNIALPLYREGLAVVMKDKTAAILEGYGLLETFLTDNEYVTGDSLTIADFCCVATATSLHGIVEIKSTKYPKLAAWIDRIAQLPYYAEANGKGVKAYTTILKKSLTTILV